MPKRKIRRKFHNILFLLFFNFFLLCHLGQVCGEIYITCKALTGIDVKIAKRKARDATDSTDEPVNTAVEEGHYNRLSVQDENPASTLLQTSPTLCLITATRLIL